MKSTLDEATDHWGILVDRVEMWEEDCMQSFTYNNIVWYTHTYTYIDNIYTYVYLPIAEVHENKKNSFVQEACFLYLLTYLFLMTFKIPQQRRSPPHPTPTGDGCRGWGYEGSAGEGHRCGGRAQSLQVTQRSRWCHARKPCRTAGTFICKFCLLTVFLYNYLRRFFI